MLLSGRFAYDMLFLRSFSGMKLWMLIRPTEAISSDVMFTLRIMDSVDRELGVMDTMMPIP